MVFEVEMMVHPCNPSTQEAEARVQDQPGYIVPLGWRECFPSDGPICDTVAVSAAASKRTR